MTVTLPPGWRTNPVLAESLLDTLRKAREKKLPPLQYDTPGDLARALDPTVKQTPALDLIDAELVRAYNTPGARLAISMPPQEGKSQRATIIATLWALINNPERRIGVASYGVDLAATFGREIREHITNHQGQEGTLDLRLRMAKDNNAAARWKLAGHKGGLLSVGIGSGFSGKPIDALVIDDPFADAEQAASEAYRDKVWEWWTHVARPRLGSGAPVIVIMTRWHEDDLLGRLLKAESEAIAANEPSYDKWRVINIPAQADHKPEEGQTDPLGRQPGEYMVSARGRSVQEWQATKLASGSRTWAALYQGHPTPDSGNILLRSWWRTYTRPLWSTDGKAYRIVDGYDELFSSWDMTFKDTKGTDYVVGQLWMRRNADAFLLDQVRARMAFPETLSAFEAFAARWPQCRTHLIEDKANGPAVISSLRKKIPGIIPVTPRDSKLARASAVAPFVEAGNVHLPDPEIAIMRDQDNAAEVLISEAAAFPGAAHDDTVDAFSQAMDRFFLAGAGADAWKQAIEARTHGDKVAAVVEDIRDAVEQVELDPLTAARNQAFRNQQFRR